MQIGVVRFREASIKHRLFCIGAGKEAPFRLLVCLDIYIVCADLNHRYVNYKFKANESTAQMYNDTLLPILQDIEKVMETDPRCKEVKKAVVAEIDKRLMLCEDPAKKPGSAM